MFSLSKYYVSNNIFFTFVLIQYTTYFVIFCVCFDSYANNYKFKTKCLLTFIFIQILTLTEVPAMTQEIQNAIDTLQFADVCLL